MRDRIPRFWLWSEMCLLFFLLPLSYLTNIHTSVKFGLTLAALAWVIRCAWRMDLFRQLGLFLPVDRGFLVPFFLRLAIALSASYIFMSRYHPEDRFLIFSDMGLFVRILFIYSFLSVSVQEFVYRPFFFHRYASLFGNSRLGATALILVNAALFGWAHVFFGSWSVFFMTLAGGLLFAYTWYRSQSYMWVWIEHVIYGVWLFILGVGGMLAFPMPAPTV